MADNYVSTSEAVLTSGIQAIVGAGLGRFLDNTFPPPDDGKSDLQLGLEVGGQFVVGMATLCESMRALQPHSPEYQTPVGDGTAIFFFYSQQPNFLVKCNDLARRATQAARRAIGVPEPDADDVTPVSLNTGK